jgi:hypothetical protein
MRTASPRRSWTTFLLGVFLLAWGLDAHHRAWVPHVVCELDGEVAHGGHADHRGHESRDAHDEDEPAPRVVRSGADDEEHAHCGLSELGRTSTLDLAPAPKLGPPPCIELESRLTAGAPAHEAVSRVSLAPKQSPPRAV